jgi:DNA-binding helix-hairpin-helix protein with protein kinase domain
MIGRLATGTVVRLRNHDLDCVVDECLGAGGQGEVYRVSVTDGPVAQDLALKWYFPAWSNRQHWTDLLWLTEQAPPNASFLWPVDVAVAKVGRQSSSFGYVMPLRPPRFHGCVGILTGRLQISTAPLLKACLRLADSFLALHAKGLCYRDINFGNAFIDPISGDVLIADNDNVAINREGSVGVQGTPKFMAPEVVRGDAPPSVDSDLYSLAVLLFYLLMLSHPLEGVRMMQGDVFGGEDAADLYGWHPLFVFDPEDRSNRPDPEQHDTMMRYWSCYPQMLRDLFVRAFTDGLHDPVGGRVRESEWRDCMSCLIDLLVPCLCGAGVFVEPDGRPVTACWQCSSPAPAAADLPMLVLDPGGERHPVALNPGRRLFAHHLGRRRYDYKEVSGEVVRHPDAPDVLGLRNLSPDPWVASTCTGAGAAGTQVVVVPGRSVTIAPGTSIDFGGVRGIVQTR